MARVLIKAEMPDNVVAKFLKSLEAFGNSTPGHFNFDCGIQTARGTEAEIKEAMDSIPGGSFEVIRPELGPLEVN